MRLLSKGHALFNDKGLNANAWENLSCFTRVLCLVLFFLLCVYVCSLNLVNTVSRTSPTKGKFLNNTTPSTYINRLGANIISTSIMLYPKEKEKEKAPTLDVG